MKILVTKPLTASKDKAWENLKNFAGIQNYNPSVATSKPINDKVYGIGAERSCVLTNGDTIKERITDYTENESYKVDIYDMGKMPLKYAHADIGINEKEKNSYELYMSMDIKAKMGPAGWIMERMMKKPYTKLLASILEGLDTFSQTGVPVKKK